MDANDVLHYETEGSVKSAKLQTHKWTISASYPLIQHATAMINANLLRLSRQLDPHIVALAVGTTFFESMQKRILAFYRYQSAN